MKALRWLAVAGLGLAVLGCSRALATDPPPGPRVEGVTVSFPLGAAQLGALRVEPASDTPDLSRRLAGRLAWDEDATARVFTPFAGRVRRVLVDVGGRVRRGTPLAEIESPDFAQAQADARTAASALAYAESERARLRDLYEHGAAARKELEAADAERARAGAESERAASRLAAYGAGADSVSGRFLLRSPLDGTVVERNLTPGQEVRPDQMLANAPSLFAPLFVVSDPGRLWVQIDATEFELDGLAPGVPFAFSCAAWPGRAFRGVVRVVGAGLDPATHTVHVRGEVADPRHQLKPEMFVSVEVRGRPPAGTSVPAAAVYLRGDRHFVFVESLPGCFTRREVRVGTEDAGRVVVTAGVRAGERVVSDGAILLQQLLD